MKSISVGQLRQNPTHALDEVERGESYLVTRHSRGIALLVPVPSPRHVSAEQAMSIYGHSPLPDDSWSAQLAQDRATPQDSDW